MMSVTGGRGPRVLHTALMSTYEPGIYRQMAWEAEAAKAEGLPWRTRIFTSLEHSDPAGIMVPWRPGRWSLASRLSRWVAFRQAYYAWIASQAAAYDVLLLRHHAYDPFAARHVGRLDCVWGSVHHTLDVPELHTQPHVVKGRVLAAAERVLGTRNLRAADVIVAVAPEIARYENARLPVSKPTLIYPNGALLADEVVDRRGAVPELLFVSGSFRPWHGLDLLLASLAGTDEDFTLHVVGAVEPAVLAGCADRRVVFHGVLDEEALAELTTRAWVGISTLALHRHGMAGSPLKVRGYLAQGVPVYGGSPDVFPPSSPVYRVGEPDVARVLAYAHELRQVPRETVRSEAEGYIDKRVLVRALYASLTTFAADAQNR